MADEREFKIRHTSEGADKTRKEIEKLADAEGKVKGQTEKVGEAVDKTTASTSDFSAILDKVSPGLGGMVIAMESAFKVAGDLGGANIKLTGIMAGVRAATIKYKNSLLLLGAGGAAIGAVLFLLATWERMRKELEKIQELQRRIREENRNIIDKARSVQERIVEAVESGEIAVPTDKEIKRIKRDVGRLVFRGVKEATAFQIAIGKRAPLEKSLVEFLERERGVLAERARIGAEISAGKTLGTKDLKFIADQLGKTIEGAQKAVDDLQVLLNTGDITTTRGFFERFNPLTPTFGKSAEEEVRESDARLLATLVKLLQLLDGSKGLRQATPPAPVGPPSAPPRPPSATVEPSGALGATFFGLPNKSSHRAAEKLERAANASVRASEALVRAADRIDVANDRQVANLSRNGTTARFQNMAAGEG